MRDSRYFKCILIVGSLLSALTLPAVPTEADESNGTPAARSYFERGEAALKTNTPEGAKKAAAAFRKAIELDPDFAEAHEKFIQATVRAGGTHRADAEKKLRATYHKWAARHPNRAANVWGMGVIREWAVTTDHDPAEKPETYFLKAVDIDPGFAPAYYRLASIAVRRGENDKRLDYLRRAVEGNPRNPKYLVAYGYALKSTDAAGFRRLLLETVDKFPTSQAAAQALYELAAASEQPEEKRRLLERLRDEFPPEQGYWQMGAAKLFAIYSEDEPVKALSLAREAAKAFPTSKTWAERVKYQDSVIKARASFAEREIGEALSLLEAATPPAGVDPTPFHLLNAQISDAAGHTENSYRSLAEQVVDSQNDRLLAALLEYGAKLEKKPEQVDAELWALRESRAEPAKAFELRDHFDDKPVRLADYRGRVVLVSFWSPG